MGSVAARNGASVKLPRIKLDTTFTELYKRASPKDASTRLGWISCGVSTGIDLTAGFPRNTKFVYQDQAFVKAAGPELNNGNAGLQWSLAQKYLSLIPQRDAFVSGSTPVIFFNLDRTPEQLEHDRREAEATISVLEPSQRPELIFCPGPAEIPVKEHRIDKLEYKVIADALERYPLTHDLEAHWFLNSKAALARSGLPTPRADIIETEGCPPAADACCGVCAAAAKDTSRLPTIPPGCTGPRGAWLSAQAERILAAVRRRPVPFVFKTQQAFGGAGTWLVTSAEQKEKLIAELSGGSSDRNADTTTTTTTLANGGPDNPTDQQQHQQQQQQQQQQQEQQEEEEQKQQVHRPPGNNADGLLRRLLSLLTPHNAALRPTTVLLTELVRHEPPGGTDFGLTFVVTAAGEAVFLAAAEQMLATTTTNATTTTAVTTTASNGSGNSNRSNDEDGSSSSSSGSSSSSASSGGSSGAAWVGSTINYARQGALRRRFAGLIAQIAAWVRERGYVGPVGADVLTTGTLAEAESGAGQDSEDGGGCFVVDLNVRTCGSLALPLLRGHFLERRGLACAGSLSVAYRGRRGEFMERWRAPLEEGRMVILSWYEDPRGGGSIGDVVVGAEDEGKLKELMQAVRESTEELTL
ncbi:d4653150-3f13-4d9f-a910-56b8c7cf7620 [Thermothielavioides terrestris]|uniref:D4653150-3f13-4d9f-a910-56b8c7cf7620 n=1 Tax=Thermothielavioides terrestris TaxID=2587410 RepID=A0A446BBF4_9PEZI|nr:d4653150-3f13-4d9f-a910-56b8c7cf7620 [Thermothielavioides terrestris]